jgi:hypothetical protein
VNNGLQGCQAYHTSVEYNKYDNVDVSKVPMSSRTGAILSAGTGARAILVNPRTGVTSGSGTTAADDDGSQFIMLSDAKDVRAKAGKATGFCYPYVAKNANALGVGGGMDKGLDMCKPMSKATHSAKAFSMTMPGFASVVLVPGREHPTCHKDADAEGMWHEGVKNGCRIQVGDFVALGATDVRPCTCVCDVLQKPAPNSNSLLGLENAGNTHR